MKGGKALYEGRGAGLSAEIQAGDYIKFMDIDDQLHSRLPLEVQSSLNLWQCCLVQLSDIIVRLR